MTNEEPRWVQDPDGNWHVMPTREQMGLPPATYAAPTAVVRKRGVPPLAIIAGVVLVAGAVAFALGSARGTTSMAASSTTSSAAPTTQPASTAPPTTNLDAAMAAWAEKALPRMSAIGAAMKTFGANPSAATVHPSMEAVMAADRDLAAILPSPDESLTAELRAAIDEIDQGAQLTITGFDNQDAATINRATEHIQAGNRHINRATARMDEMRKNSPAAAPSSTGGF